LGTARYVVNRNLICAVGGWLTSFNVRTGNSGVKKLISFFYFTGEEKQPEFYGFYHMKKSL
jgi:hypothetical protein